VIAQGTPTRPRGIDVEINISASSIGDPELVAVIERELERTGADPSRLVFEITETALIEKTEVAGRPGRDAARAGLPLRARRLRHRLRRLPLPQGATDGLPQDRPRVRPRRDEQRGRPARDPRDRRARQGFGLQTIGEGVEDEATLELLREFGVDHAQGFHLGRPRRYSPLAAGPCAPATGRARPRLRPRP
jgi:hypothetical protein